MKKILVFALLIFVIMLIIPTLSLNIIEKNNVKKSEPKLNEETYAITVYDVNKKENFSIEMEEYLKGVIAAEMPAEFEIEALKAQAVTARTYLLHHLKKYENGHPDHPQAAICTGIHCQVWHSQETLKSIHPNDWFEKYWDKIEDSVNSTKGEVLVYDAKIIEPLFHSTSGGKTENSEDVFQSAVPYLRSVDSPYELEAPKLHGSVNISIDDFITKLNDAYGKLSLTANNLKDKIILNDISEGGKVKTVKIDSIVVSGRDIRTLFNLNSTNFKFVQSGNEIEILTTGYGHGVGMSQWGANGMAENGSNYIEILKHYYTGIEIMNISE